MVEEDKLWFIGGGAGVRARPRRECITKAEAVARAREEHENNGHWHRDAIKLALLDRYHGPRMDESIVTAITDCARCKSFGGTHLHALLNPITRRHPFELLVGDYLSMPAGKGGYKTIGLYLDTFSQHVWGFMFKTHGSAATTAKSLTSIFHNFAPPETVMTDGGSHFNNQEIRDLCAEWGATLHVTPAYSPWVNGLVEGTNRLLLYILARLCAPEMGEDGWQDTDWKSLPSTWPDHFDKAIQILNWRILSAIKFSPKELLLGLVVNTPRTPVPLSTKDLSEEEMLLQMAYTAQQRLDGYAEAVEHATKRKRWFDSRVQRSKAGLVEFKAGDLVQFFRSELNNTLRTEKKITPMWSALHRVVERIVNSYRLETLDGRLLEGTYSARRLRRFIPREGTMLAEEQRLRGEKITPDADEGSTAPTIEEIRESTSERGEMEAEREAAFHHPMGAESDLVSDNYSVAGNVHNGSIANRIASRRRGRRHEEGGQM